MSIKRLLPILIVVVVGFLTLSSHFINNEAVDKFVGEDATGWYNIIAAFAVFLGSLNLIKFQFSKIVHKKKDWNYSILTLLSFFVMIFFAFFMMGAPDSEPFEDINGNGKWDDKMKYQKKWDEYQEKWDDAEEFTDTNNNNKWDDDEEFTDTNKNGKWDDREKFYDQGNGIYDINEIFTDDNGNYQYDIGEEWIDLGNGKYDEGESFEDIEPDSLLHVKAESFVDAGYDLEGNYIYEKFCQLNASGNIIESTCIDNPDWKPEYGNNQWDKKVKWGAHVTYAGTNKDEYDGHYPGSYIKWLYEYIYTPLSATMFALLAFFVASASYRAFRIRNFEATLLLVAGVLLMLGRVPLGNTAYIPWWVVLSIYIFGIFALIAPFFKNRKLLFLSIIYSFIGFGLFGFISGWNINPPEFLQLPSIQRWIFFNPQLAAARAIKIGIALGIIATSFRIITGRERGIFGD